MSNENLKFQGVKFQLFQDADGFWGWVVGAHTMTASFSSRISALRTAQRHIQESE